MSSEANPKRVRFKSRKILNAARGEECTIETPYCNKDSSTVVAAHSNQPDDGKGRAQKADDCFVAFACFECHRVLDREHPETKGWSTERIMWYHDRGIKRTIRRLLDMGVLVVK